MRKLSSLFVLAVLATPATAADRPWVKFSFSLPTEDPTFNGFDPAPLQYHRDIWDTHVGLPDGAPVTARTLSSYAHLTPQPGRRSMGARLRVQTWDPWKEEQTPWALDLSWVKEQRTITQVWGSEFVAIGTYRNSCLPHWEGPCVDFANRSRNRYDSQYRGHDLTLHVFRFGLNYDLLYNTKRFSLEPGIGLEWSVAKHRRDLEGTQCRGTFGENCERDEYRSVTNWPNINEQTGYVSLSSDVYPFGKRRFVSVGASTRYLLTSGDWAIQDGTVLGNYEVTIRSRRWSTSFHATLAF